MTNYTEPITKQTKIPGILGGLGPLAHIEFERRLIEKSAMRGAQCDQDHPVWVLAAATDIPDRTKSLQGEAEDCTPWFVRYGQRLEAAGANFLVITCNTAHAFYDRVQPQLRIPWIHLMECTAQFIVEHYPGVQQVGVLATDGTLQAGLYSKSLARLKLTPVMPTLDSSIQRQVMQAIYHPTWGIKASGIDVSASVLDVLDQAITWLKHQGAELVIAGCTEISVGLARMKHLALPWVDPLDIVAAITFDLAFGHRQLHSVMAA